MLFAQLGQVDRIQGRSVRLFYRLLTLGVNYARSLSSLVECNYVSEITGIGLSKLQCGEKWSEPVRDQLPAHHQGETPATRQSPGPAHQGESI